jgi:Lysylphosphatidylglycerol synthase TM region
VLGDVHRAVRHGRDSGDVGRGVRAVVIERTGGQVVLAAAGVAALATRPEALRVVLSPAAAGLLAVSAVVLAVAWRWGRRTRLWTDLRLSRDTWPGVLALSAVALAGHLTLFLVSARVAGVPASFVRLLPLMVLALVAMGLPVNVGGWGPREGVSAWAFGAAGLGATEGVTVAVVYGVLTFVSCLPGALVLIARRRRPEVELQQRVVAEGEPAHRHARRVAHPQRAGEAQAGHPVAQEHRRDRDVQPLEHLSV